MNPEAQTALAKWREENPDAIGIRRNPIQKLVEKPTSRSLAIQATCYMCMGCDSSWRNDVKNCTAPQCPLFPFRLGAKDGDFDKFIVANAKLIEEVAQEGAGD